MSKMHAADLTFLRQADPLWRLREFSPLPKNPGNPSALAKSLGLPSRGFASPLGFWFAPEETWGDPPPYRIEFVTPDRLKSIARLKSQTPRVIASDAKRRVVVIDRHKSRTDSGRMRQLDLAIDGRSARIEVDDVAWPEAGEAALLAVTTFWRLQALDHCFDRFTDLAREILDRGGRRSIWPVIWRHPVRRNRAVTIPSEAQPKPNRWEEMATRHHPISASDLQRQGRSLILDLPELEGPLTDPAQFVRSHKSAWLYRRLCGKLGLLAWRDRIDERAEVLDGILDTLNVRHDHRQVIALEIVIILLLTIDIALAQILSYWE